MSTEDGERRIEPAKGSTRPSRWRRRLPELVLATIVVSGLALLVVRLLLPLPRSEVHVDSFEPAEPSATVVVAIVSHDTCTSDLQGEAVEYRELVLVTVTARVDDGDCDSVGILERVEIPLDLPIGSRLLIDASCSISMDDRTPCPVGTVATG